MDRCNLGKVGIVVVTYNRLSDLIVCINSVRNQSYQYFDLIIVDNGSVDGTKEYLDSQQDLYVIHQGNEGGAGGFYTGMKYVDEHNYDWLLMLDDDGIMSNDELFNLVTSYEYISKKENRKMILNALVVNKDNHNETAFLWARGSGRSNQIVDLQKDCYFTDIHPFNGTLIKKDLLKVLGYTKKEMFIWGDEEEYVTRALSLGFGVCTVTSALHFHPKEKGEKGFLFPFCPKYFIILKPQKMSHYFYRNRGFIYGNYKIKHKHIIPFVLANVFFNVTHLKFRELIKFIKYFYRGIKNDYSI